jgi:phosphate transport system substrate-binding protein
VAGIKPGDLLLTGQVLADIYLGRITRWNDKAIAELNPNVSLPNAGIAVIRRADGSGTTFALTNYLSRVSDKWKSRVGEGTVVQWPTGMGGKGNEGVSAFLQRIQNSIGYVESAYATQSKLAWVRMKNADGHIVSPSEAAFKAAAEGADWDASGFGVILTNQPGENSWPLASATFILMHKIQDRPTQGAESLKFFDWAFRHGGQMASDLEYVPLPDSLVQSIRASWKNITDASGKPVFSSR